MIVSLQRKFILISVASVLVVFSGIFLLLVLSSSAQMERTMDTLTDAIAANDGVFPEFDFDRQGAPSRGFPYDNVITEETRFSTRFFTVWLDKGRDVARVNTDAVSSLTREEVEEYAKQALERGRERGWLSDYRYKLQSTPSGVTIVFVNGRENQLMTSRLLFTAFLVLLGSAVLIVTLIVLISKRVVRPVA